MKEVGFSQLRVDFYLPCIRLRKSLNLIVFNSVSEAIIVGDYLIFSVLATLDRPVVTRRHSRAVSPQFFVPPNICFNSRIKTI